MGVGFGQAAKSREDAHASLDRLIADNPRLSQAVDLVAQGLSYREVAKALGWRNASVPFRLIKRYNELVELLEAFEVVHEVRTAVRTVDKNIWRCAQLIEEHGRPYLLDAEGRRTEEPNPLYKPSVALQAMRVQNDTLDLRAKLLGLYAPDRVSVTHQVDSLAAWASKLVEGGSETPAALLDGYAPVAPAPSPDNGTQH